MSWPITRFPLVCRSTGVEHIVSLGLPARHASLERMPLLLCLDGPWMFGTTLDATRIMSMSGEAPEAAVVGLSFSEHSMGEYLRQRARWYTPTPWVPPAITGVRGVEAEECGRADELLRFIRDQLLPLIQSEEHVGEVEIGERWLIGHSFSALFGLVALWTDPSLFDKWLLASPSIWWDSRAVLGREARYAAANDDLKTALFTCYGEAEGEPMTEVGIDFDFRMGANVEDLVTTLRSRRYPGLRLSHEVLPGDAHASSIGSAISKGLRALL